MKLSDIDEMTSSLLVESILKASGIEKYRLQNFKDHYSIVNLSPIAKGLPSMLICYDSINPLNIGWNSYNEFSSVYTGFLSQLYDDSCIAKSTLQAIGAEDGIILIEKGSCLEEMLNNINLIEGSNPIDDCKLVKAIIECLGFKMHYDPFTMKSFTLHRDGESQADANSYLELNPLHSFGYNIYRGYVNYISFIEAMKNLSSFTLDGGRRILQNPFYKQSRTEMLITVDLLKG